MGLVSSPSFFLPIFCTLVCQETCSGHGKCNVTTKRCVCDSFWVENPFKANFGMKETNCGEIAETKRYPIRFPPRRLESRLCRRSRRRSWSHTPGCSVGLHLSLARVSLYRFADYLSLHFIFVSKRIRARRRLRYALLSDKDDDSEMVPLSTLSKSKTGVNFVLFKRAPLFRKKPEWESYDERVFQ